MAGTATPVGAVTAGPVETEPAAPARRRRADLSLLGAILLPAAVLVVLGWTERWVADDAFVNFRVVDQLLAGNGPVFNDGERVEAYSSTLWLLALALFDGTLPFAIEWSSVIAGLALSGLGVVLGVLAASESARRDAPRAAVLPLGALAFVALPPVWESATSGLQTGLVLAWIGWSSLLLARLQTRRPARRGALLLSLVVLGLGPLVDAELVVFSVVFVTAALVLAGRPLLWRGAGLLAVAVALPLVHQLLRMGYFAALVPNPSIAREADFAYWSQGARYLGDLLAPYWLWVPLLALGALIVLRRSLRAPAVAAPVLAGLLSVVLVVRAGGDFAHARALLPGVFAILVPLAAPLTRRPAELAVAAVVLAWCVVCALTLRPDYWQTALSSGPQRIVHAQGAAIAATGVAHPITVADYDAFPWREQGRRLRERARRGEAVLTYRAPNREGRTAPRDSAAARRPPVTVFAASAQVGVVGYAAGPEVWIVDRSGFADPIAGRLRVYERGRPGSEKYLPYHWVHARFGRFPLVPPSSIDRGFVEGSVRVLKCRGYLLDGTGARSPGSVRELLAAVEQPMTASRFVRNLGAAARNTSLRIPSDPFVAAGELCA